MKKMQKGFTLIELMIVIAIIGILAAIALPAYQDYLARTQASEGFKASSGLQADIGVYASANSTLNGVQSDPNVAGTVSELGGKYFSKGSVSVDNTTGAYTINFNAGANSNKNLVVSTPQLVKSPSGFALALSKNAVCLLLANNFLLISRKDESPVICRAFLDYTEKFYDEYPACKARRLYPN